jgi:excisionase family DNA binding protein
MTKKYLTADEMAKLLGCSGRTLIRMTKKTNVPHIIVGTKMRFDPEKVIAFLESSTADAAVDPVPLRKRRVPVPAPVQRSEFAGILSGN